MLVFNCSCLCVCVCNIWYLYVCCVCVLCEFNYRRSGLFVCVFVKPFVYLNISVCICVNAESIICLFVCLNLCRLQGRIWWRGNFEALWIMKIYFDLPEKRIMRSTRLLVIDGTPNTPSPLENLLDPPLMPTT